MATPAHIAFTQFRSKRLHLGVCGSIAAYKSIELFRMLQKSHSDISVTLTKSAQQFISCLNFEAMSATQVFHTQFPGPGDETTPYGHLYPGQNCDAMLIAPCTANMIAKLANGLADDMLSTQALSFSGPLLIAPAMNCALWNAPATQRNVEKLKESGVHFVGPDSGDLACGDTGEGRLTSLEDIFLHTLRALSPHDFSGKKTLVTLGPTREPWDAVRFWSNPSSGAQGAALATAAWLRGADVYAICGPCSLKLPTGIHRVDVKTAGEMFSAVSDMWSDMDIGAFVAAVADFHPEPFGVEKFKKSTMRDGFEISYVPNPDIINTVGHQKARHQKIIGFAAETSQLEDHARCKLKTKHADMVIANLINTPQSGFQSPTNQVFVTDATGREEHWPLLPKTEIAWRILDWISQQ